MHAAVAAMLAPMFPDALATARLRLRPVAAGDAPAIFERYARDPEVTRFLTWRTHRTVADAETYVALCLAMRPEVARVYALTERDGGVQGDGARAGASLGTLHLRGPAPHRVEFGYVLARPHWGRGLMTEALRAAVDWALAEPGLFRVGAVCDVDNAASARVMEKAGLIREGLLRRWMVHPNASDDPRDCLAYGRAW